MFQLEFYETEDGKKPVEEFLDSLDAKMNAKLVSMMELLEEKGTLLLLHGQKDCCHERVCKENAEDSAFRDRACKETAC